MEGPVQVTSSSVSMRISTSTSPPRWTLLEGSWRLSQSLPTLTASDSFWSGQQASGTLSRSESRVPVPTVPDSPRTLDDTVIRSSKSLDRIGDYAGSKASQTPSMPRTLPVPYWPASPLQCLRPAMAPWR